MPGWVKFILQFILHGLGVGAAPDPVQQATDTGEKLGKSEEAEANAAAAVGELEHAQQGAADAAAARASDPDKLRTDGPDVRPYKPGYD